MNTSEYANALKIIQVKNGSTSNLFSKSNESISDQKFFRTFISLSKTDEMKNYVVLLLNQLDDVGWIVGQNAVGGSLDVPAQLFVNADLFSGDSEDQIHRVLLHFSVDLSNGRIILQTRVSVPAWTIQVAFTIVRFNDSSQLEKYKAFQIIQIVAF